MFVLDTNVISELRRPERADRKVVAWAASLPLAQFFLSAITVLELEYGVLQRERSDPAQGAVLRGWLRDQVLPQFDGRILAFDSAVALVCARLHAPDRRSDRDAMIAATAIVHNMTVATRNVQDFQATDTRVLNPWDAR